MANPSELERQTETKYCLNCMGLGHLIDPMESTDDQDSQIPCRVCNATGRVPKTPGKGIGCKECQILRQRIVELETVRDRLESLLAALECA